ncbi:MAG: Nucleolar protein 58 [Paramarteilia canceri]
MFSTENIDTMVIQAVTLLDNVEKELNSYIQRIKEWYGWHFPELLKTFADPLSYLAFITAFGSRKEFIATMNSVEKSKYSKILQNKLLDDVITEDMLEEIISLADTSIGLDLNFEDCEAIQLLCKQALELAKYKMQLTDYLSMRMNDICPNLTEVLGNTLGAKMLSHVGSLSNLASKPGSTIQILGAEKALFKAIKSRGNTPKYGLIYNAPLVQQVNKQDRGKIARSLAAKAALAARLDYNQEDKTGKNGAMMKKKMELRIRQVTAKSLKKAANPKDKPQFQSKKMHSFQKRGYNQKMDSAKPFSKIRKDE